MDRRTFCKTLAGATGITLAPLRRSGWAASAPSGNGKRLVVVMLRGAVDGLSVVVPYGDPSYYRARTAIAIAPPGNAGGALDLDGHFGLHPALAPLLPLWQQGTLAFVHASGSPDATRSHFDAQDYMESGTPGRKSTPDGWMNRLIGVLPGPHAPTTAVSLGAVLPRVLSGPNAVANLPAGPSAVRPAALDRPEVSAAFDRLYAGDDRIATAYQEGRSARREMLSDLAEEMQAADNGGAAPAGFPQEAGRLATLVRRDANLRLAFVSLGGWDTHVNQGGAQGQLANHLRPLGEGLAGLAQGLGPELANTLIVVMSEFGRTVRQNGNGGTDHGHGNAMWVLGGGVAGRRIYGEWPGLADASLYQGRDLAVTTDFRLVLARALERHLRLTDTQVQAVLPGLPAGGQALSGLLTA